MDLTEERYRMRNTVTSSYWKIPDKEEYLTAVAAHETQPLVAVASGARDCNLFIYEVDSTQEIPQQRRAVSLANPPVPQSRQLLTHHQTITLPEIHSLAWASPFQTLGGYGNVLATGHNLGMVHLTLLPEPYSNEPAEILRRYDHKRHLRHDQEDEGTGTKSMRVKHVNIVGRNWMCCPDSSIMTLFNENLFLWDPARSDRPILKKKTRGTVSFDACDLRDGIVAFGGRRGISITDLRVKNSPVLSPPSSENETFVSHVKWASRDENLVAAVHDYMTVKIWDIRAGKPMVTLFGHNDRVNSLLWPEHDSNELVSASSDGTVRMWNIKNCVDLQSEPAPTPSLFRRQVRSVSSPAGRGANSSISSDLSSTSPTEDMEWLPKPWQTHRHRLSRQDEVCTHMSYFLEMSKNKAPSTTVFSDSKEFVSVAAIAGKDSIRIASIDNDGYFGLHSRRQQRPLSSISTDTENDLFSSAASTTSVSSMDSEPLSVPKVRHSP
uniref:ARAD1B17490p n=1 Tax=Blastobotrys adeninivorans TaxID=409370 RepID=A0A060TCM1_BLAAD